MSRPRHGESDEPPPLFEGQTIGKPSSSGRSSNTGSDRAPSEAGRGSPAGSPTSSGPITSGILTSGPVTGGEDRGDPGPSPQSSAGAGREEAVDVQGLRLPTGRSSVVKYLANSYKGVGKKTAESLFDELGDDLFPTLQSDPDRVKAILNPARAEQVLEGWRADYERRSSRMEQGNGGNGGNGGDSGGDAGTSGGGRRRGGRRTRSRSSR